MSTNANNDAPDVDALLTTIAQDFLNVETLEGRKSDDLDFYSCSVWQTTWDGTETVLRPKNRVRLTIPRIYFWGDIGGNFGGDFGGDPLPR